MIYDCFPFYNELDLLEVRLHELYDVVDYFVLSEATRTHSGQYKPLYYKMNKPRFQKFQDKIIHVVVDNMPMTREELDEARVYTDGKWATGDIVGNNWTRERWQRDAMMKVLKDCDPEDIIILGDADEIVRASTVKALQEILHSGLVAVEQSLYSYYLNWKCVNMPWHGTKVFKRKNMTTLSQDRFHTKPICTFLNGGWHLNFMGGIGSIKSKVQAYVHQEFNTPTVLNNLGNRLQEGKDALGRLYQYEIVPIDETYPKYIRENLDKFQDWIYK